MRHLWSVTWMFAALSWACASEDKRPAEGPGETWFEVNGLVLRGHADAQLVISQGEGDMMGERLLTMGAGGEDGRFGRDGPVTGAGFGLWLPTTQTGIDGVEGSHALGQGEGQNNNMGFWVDGKTVTAYEGNVTIELTEQGITGTFQATGKEDVYGPTLDPTPTPEAMTFEGRFSGPRLRVVCQRWGPPSGADVGPDGQLPKALVEDREGTSEFCRYALGK